MAINATAKSTTADSWLTLAEADSYHAGRLFNSEWTLATDEQKEIALKWSSKLLNLLSWKGYPTDSDQAQSQPRIDLKDRDGYAINKDVVYQDMKDACAEYAWVLLKSDTTKESDTTGISRIKVAVIELDINSIEKKKKIPTNVMDYIKPWVLNYSTSSVGKG